jgi:hypothetical protein
MKLHHLVLAAGILATSACATNTEASSISTPASSAALQETASLMATYGQHGEGVDRVEASAELDAKTAASPNDPYVLKLVAMTRRSLSDHAEGAERTRLRQQALADLDRAIALTRPDMPSRIVRLNGQDTEIDLKDLPDLRAQLQQQIQAGG